MKETFDEKLSYKNAAHATWQFANEMKVGDIIFVKKGMHQLVGRGVVTSDYEFDGERSDEYKNTRQVNWTHKGEWPHPGQAVMKTLTDITSYTDYVENSMLYLRMSLKKMLRKLRSLTRYIQKTISCQRSSCQRKSTISWLVFFV